MARHLATLVYLRKDSRLQSPKKKDFTDQKCTYKRKKLNITARQAAFHGQHKGSTRPIPSQYCSSCFSIFTRSLLTTTLCKRVHYHYHYVTNLLSTEYRFALLDDMGRAHPDGNNQHQGQSFRPVIPAVDFNLYS